MSWKIYHKDGSLLADVNDEQISVHKLEYSDKWMEECFVTIDFKNNAPIRFEIGDYLIYRNGERFELNYDPGKQKQARANAYGEGFVYEGVKLNSLQDELARSEFLDVVLNDNQLHYTSLPKFSFYVETIDDLLDRIQANLNEQIGDGKWKIFSRSLKRSMQRGVTEEEWKAVYGDEETSAGDFDSQSVTVDSQTCWQALALANEKWDINFVVRNRNVYVGTAGKLTKGIFKYGLGKGLYEVDKNADSDQSIITRLRAYGSEKNLPDHYYADLGSTPFLNVTGDYKPGSTEKGLSVLLEDSVYEGMFTNVKSDNGSNMKHVIVSCEIDGYKFDAELELVLKQSPACTTRLLVENNKTVSDAVKAKIDAGFKQVLFISGAKVTKFNGNRINYVQNLPNNMSINRLMLPGFPSMSLNDFWESMSESEKAYVNPSGKKHVFSTDKYRPYVDSVNIESIGLRSASQFFDTDDKTNGVIEIYPTIEEMVVGGVRIDEIYIGSSVDDNGRYDTESPKNIDIYLNPAIDFDINDLRDDDFSISMKDGMCGGRTFKVASCSKVDGRWRLTIERVKDDALDLWFPYNDYQIKAGDHFVLTGIGLPESYIRAASLKLLKYAIALLDKNDYTRYVYQPKVDEIFMARQHDEAMADKTGALTSYHDTLKAGDIMQFEDEDLGIDAKITIDHLTIKEEDGKIPTYEITLREDKEVGTIQKIQQQISSLSSGNGGTGSGSGLTTGQVSGLIPSEGAKYFLSKLQDDTAQGIISFMKGIVSKGRIDAEKGLLLGDGSHSISENGDAVLGDVVVDRIHDAASTPSERIIIGAQGFDLYMGDDGKSHLYLDNLIVRQKFFASSAEIRKISYSGGTTVFSNAGSILAKVSAVFDSTGACVAYKCYACADDGTTKTMNWWHVGMMALCQTFNVKAGKTDNLQNRYYWRLVVGVGQETLEDGKLYDYVVLSNKEKFLGSDSYVPTYTDKVIADENEATLVFGDYGVEVTTDGGMGSMAGVFFEQEGTDTDDGGNKIANRYFYGYEPVGGAAPDAPTAGDVIVQVGDQIRWKSRGNVIKLTTSTEDNASDNAPSITMYHNLGALYSTGKKDANDNDIISPYQWKSCTAVISPEMVKFNSNNFAWFTDDPDKVISPITVMYSIETSGMFRVGSDGRLYGDNKFQGLDDYRFVSLVCYRTIGDEKNRLGDNSCFWTTNYPDIFDIAASPYNGGIPLLLTQDKVKDAPSSVLVSCYSLATDPTTHAPSQGDVLYASVNIPIIRDGEKGEDGEKGDKGDKGDDGAPGTPGTDGKNAVSYSVSFNNQKVQIGTDTYEERIYVYVTKAVGSSIQTSVIYNAGYDFKAYVDGVEADGLKSVLKVNGYISRSAWPNATTFQINLYDGGGVLVATGSYSYGQKGEKGDDGESGLEIVLTPDTLVYDTNDDGLVTDYSQSAAIYCNKGGKKYTNVEYALYGTQNCEASYNGGTIKITKIGAQNISYTDNGTAKSLSVSVTSGHVMMRVIDKATGLYYYPLLKFSVNVAKFTGSMVANNKKFQTQFAEISNKYDNLPLKNQGELTEYTSKMEQTARKISLSVSEKAVGRRNLLIGSALLRDDANVKPTYNGNYGICGIHSLGGISGHNYFLCKSYNKDGSSLQYSGLFWRANDDGTGQNIRIECGKKYVISCWMKCDTLNVPLVIECIYHSSANETTRHGQVPIKDNTASVSVANVWELRTVVMDVTDSQYDYVEVNFWVTHSLAGKSVTACFCCPMMEEGDTYNGYSLSPYDYDYIGGNMLDNTDDFQKSSTSNLDIINSISTTTLHDGKPSAYAYCSSSESYKEVLRWSSVKTGATLEFEQHKDYTLSFWACGSGRVAAYLFKDGTPSIFVEGGENEASLSEDGACNFTLTSEWRKYVVHWRIVGDNLPAYVLIRATPSTSVYVSQPKLEEGAYPTEWTTNKKTYVEEGSLANKLLATGIDIVNKQVMVTADNFKVRNNSGVETMMVNKDGTLNASLILAQRLETLGMNGQRIVIDDGLMSVFGLAGVANWRFGLNSDKKPVLSYYDDNGSKLYDLGPGGLLTVKITEGTFTSSDYVSTEDIGLNVSSYTNVYTQNRTAKSTTGDVTIAETIFSYTSDDTKIFKTGSSKPLGEQYKKTTLYYYRAPRINNEIQADTDNKLNTQALAKQADGKYFTSKNISNGTALQNLATGCFFNASSKVSNQSKFIVAGLDEFDSISVALYAIQAPISIVSGSKSLSILGQIKSRETYTQLGSAGSVVAPID